MFFLFHEEVTKPKKAFKNNRFKFFILDFLQMRTH
jgi:hypothetical protein